MVGDTGYIVMTRVFIGYKSAGHTVHPSPRMIEGMLIFFQWVSNATKNMHWNAPKRGFTS